MTMQTVTGVTGDTFEVDTSDEACKKFKCKSGDKITFTLMDIIHYGTIIGVAPTSDSSEEDLLCCGFDKDKGKVSCLTLQQCKVATIKTS